MEQMTPMQQELLKRADAIFDYVGKTVNTAVDFAKEQIPDIAIQFISFNRVYLTLLVVASVILLIASVLSFIKCSRGESEPAIILGFFGGIVAFVIGLGMLLTNLKPCLLVWFAPKIFLMQELVHLVKHTTG